MCPIRAIAKNKTDIEYIFMTLTFRPKTITKSKTCNGDEWRRRRAIKGKCPNFPKERFLPLETSVASSETVIAPFDKKNQFGTLAFSHNSNFKFWLDWGNILCKVWVTRATTAEFRLLLKCHKYFPSCWFGSKLIEHNLFLAISPQKKKLLLPLTERLYPILTFSRSQRI